MEPESWSRTINEYWTYVSGILYYVSSTINPILYNLMSLKYRQVRDDDELTENSISFGPLTPFLKHRHSGRRCAASRTRPAWAAAPSTPGRGGTRPQS